MPDDYSKLPLRERLSIAERLTRELSEHLDQGFLPKIESLRKVTRQKDGESEVTDKTVRDTATSVRDSEKYTIELYDKLQSCLQSVATEVESMVNG